MESGSTSALRAPDGRRLRDWVHGTLEERLLAGVYRPGDRLPTENELALEFGVSRPVVRSALSRLKERGSIESIQGSGNYVRSAPAATVPHANATSVRDLQRCFEFRVLIEGEAAYLAAKRGSAKSLEAIRASVDEVDAARLAGQAKSAESFGFHRAVAAASDNAFIVSALESIALFDAFQLYTKRSAAMADPSERVALINSEHRKIYELIEQREAEEARAFMQRHIEAARDLFMECLPLGS